MRAIGYVRVSTDRQAEKGASLEAQEELVRKWAALNGAVEVLVFMDAGISGKSFKNRPGLLAALGATREGDALVVYSLSRFARNTRETLDMSEVLHGKGVNLVSLSEKIDTTSAAGNMVFQMLAVLAEFERKQISERVKTVKAMQKRQGRWLGGRRAFGWRASDEESGKGLTSEASEQTAIGLARQWREDGETLRGIACLLTCSGIRTKTGLTVWSAKVVRAMLMRETADAPAKSEAA